MKDIEIESKEYVIKMNNLPKLDILKIGHYSSINIITNILLNVFILKYSSIVLSSLLSY